MHKTHVSRKTRWYISSILLWFEATTSTKDMVPLKISSQEYQLFFTSYLQGSFLQQYIPSYILYLFGRKPYCIQDVVQDLFIRLKGFSDIPPASTLGKVCTLQFDQ